MAACPLCCKAVAPFVCFEVCFQESLTPTHFLFGLVESGAEQGQCKWEKWIKELCLSPVVVLLPLLPRNINCMQGKWRMSTAERSMDAKILSCSSRQNVSANSMKLPSWALGESSVLQKQGLSCVRAKPVCICLWWHIPCVLPSYCTLPLLLLDFRMSGKVLYVAEKVRFSLISFSLNR